MGGGRALLVEDDVRVRDVLAAYLELAGWEVRLAGDGLEGLAAAAAEPIDLIVTDIMMPNLDGLSMVRRMRCDPTMAAVPVLLISGHSDPPLENLGEGPLQFLGKPIKMADFLAELRTLVPEAG